MESQLTKQSKINITSTLLGLFVLVPLLLTWIISFLPTSTGSILSSILIPLTLLGLLFTVAVWPTVGVIIVGIVFGIFGIVKYRGTAAPWVGLALNIGALILLEYMLRKANCSIVYPTCF